ncbi:MAG: aspartate-semialdehyde dehydrogenase [Verrucomicrobiota bacterium]
MSEKKYNVAIVGATGAVGQEILEVLERRKFPVNKLKLLASERSAGKELKFHSTPIQVEAVTHESFTSIDYAFFSAGATRSREFVPAAVKAGAVVIDNSSAYRMDSAIPLVVPEVNPEDLKEHKGIIANPNCCAAILAVAVAPIHRAAGIKRMIVSTYQSASGAGAKAMEELELQAKAYATGEPMQKEVLPHQIAFNVFSHNSAVESNGYNGEENKIVAEIRKIFHAPEMPISPTCVRVPVLRAHSESVNLDLERPLSAREAFELLSKAPGIKMVHNEESVHFPMPIEATGDLDVHVGRIRQDSSTPQNYGLSLFICGDQLLKGAAWNAVQIAEELIRQREGAR